jgi:hypothetical protein
MTAASWRTIFLAGTVLFLHLETLHACNVPVFRYAMERWPADPYEVLVLHRGPLTGADLDLVDKLQQFADDPRRPANFTLHRRDLDKVKNREFLKQLEDHDKPRLPWLVVLYPEKSGNSERVWAGPLQSEAVGGLLDSPARREVCRRLLDGESAVWVFLESGNAQEDERALDFLQRELHELEKLLQLPKRTDSPRDKLLRPDLSPPRIAFSVLRVSRTDPAEAMFVSMLLHSEEGLANRKEAMVFPVYGRGIALYAILGKGITSENTGKAASFLVGACTCEEKRPEDVRRLGVNLLMTADWEGGPQPPSFLAPVSPSPKPPVSGSQDLLNFALLRNLGLAVMGGLFILGLVTIMKRDRKPRS